MTFHIVGQGLAGTCLAWQLWKLGASFSIENDETLPSSSRIAAGLANPITGMNFEPSWRAQRYLPEAIAFYRELETIFGQRIWHSLPIKRLISSEKELRKIESKWNLPEVAAWNCERVDAPEPFLGAVIVNGGGRLDTNAFLDLSSQFFDSKKNTNLAKNEDTVTIWCDGAHGILQGKYGDHRCAKGEILTLRATSDWEIHSITTGCGGWIIPVGNGIYKVGATYEWKELNHRLTTEARTWVEQIAHQLGAGDFEVIEHQAGIRPILRRSQPLIGPLSTPNHWMFNGLGSKGSMVAPSVSLALAQWLHAGTEPDDELNLLKFNGKAI